MFNNIKDNSEAWISFSQKSKCSLSFLLRKGASFGSNGKVVSAILLVESLMLESKTEELRFG